MYQHQRDHDLRFSTSLVVLSMQAFGPMVADVPGGWRVLAERAGLGAHGRYRYFFGAVVELQLMTRVRSR